MYDLLRVLHSVNRWMVLAMLLIAVTRGVRGWRTRAAWSPADARVGSLTTAVVDLQMLLGLLLYVLFSPYTRAAFADVATAITDDTLRFWLAEHGPVMIVAVALVHVGSTRSARGMSPDTASASGDPDVRSWSGHRTATIWFGAATLVILAAIPWPFLEYGRPLLPGL